MNQHLLSMVACLLCFPIVVWGADKPEVPEIPSPPGWSVTVDDFGPVTVDIERGHVSQDGRHIITVNTQQSERILVNGEAGPAYDQIVEYQLGPDDKTVAYVARRGPSWFAVIDGVISPPYKSINRIGYQPFDHRARSSVEYIGFSPAGNLVMYAIDRGDKQMLIVNGKEGPLVDKIGQRKFSPDGKRMVYLAHNNNKTLVVLDNQVIPGDYDGQVNAIQFSADGEHVTWMTHDKEGFFLVRDGVAADERYDSIVPQQMLGVGPHDTRFGYCVRKGDRMTLIVEGKAGPSFLAQVRDRGPTLFKHAATKQVAYVVGKSKDETIVVLNQKVVGTYESVTNRWLRFHQDGKLTFAAIRPDKTQVVFVGDKEIKLPSYIKSYRGVQNNFVLSPDGRRIAYVNDEDQVVVDGVAGRAGYKLISSLRFTPDSKHVWYTGHKGEGVELVLDDEIQGEFPRAMLSFENGLVFSTASNGRGGKQVVAFNGVVGPAFDITFNHLSRNGRVAYVGHDKATGNCVMLDGKRGPNFKKIEKMIYSEDGKRIVYVGKRKDERVVLMDEGHEPQVFDRVFNLEFLNDHLVFIAQKGAKFTVHIDGKAGPELAAGPEGIQLSPNGKDFVYVAKSTLYVNHQSVGTWKSVGQMIFGSDGSKFACLVSDGQSLSIWPGGQVLLKTLPRHTWSSHFQFGFSPDNQSLIVSLPRGQLANRHGVQRTETVFESFIFKNKQMAQYESSDTPLISADGSVVVHKQSQVGDQIILHDGNAIETEHHAVPSTLRLFAKNRLVYTAIENKDQRAVIDGKAGELFERIVGFQASTDGKTIVYIGKRDRLMYLVTEQKIGPAFDQIGHINFRSLDGKPVYVGIRENKYHLVIGDEIGPAADRIGVTNHSKYVRGHQVNGPVVYAVTRGDDEYFVVDGNMAWKSPFINPLREIVSQPGLHMSFVDMEAGSFVITNGVAGPQFDAIHKWKPIVTKDFTKIIYAGKRKGKTHVVVNDKEELAVDDILPESIIVGRDKHGYIAKVAGGFTAIVDGHASESFKEIRPVQLLNGQAGYWTSDEKKTAFLGILKNGDSNLIVDGRVIKTISAKGGPIVSVTINSDASHIGIVRAVEKNKQQAFIDGQPIGQPFETINQLIFTEDARGHAFVARLNELHVVNDGVQGAGYQWVEQLMFSKNGARVFYIGQRGKVRFLVQDRGEIVGPLPFITNYRLLTVDGDQLVFEHEGRFHHLHDRSDKSNLTDRRQSVSFFEYVGQGKSHRMVASRTSLTVDGKPRGKFDALVQSLQSSDGRHVAIVVRRGKQFFVVIDGHESPSFDHLSVGTPNKPGLFLQSDRPDRFTVLGARGGRMIRVTYTAKD